jgi:hypothetical protein
MFESSREWHEVHLRKPRRTERDNHRHGAKRPEVLFGTFVALSVVAGLLALSGVQAHARLTSEDPDKANLGEYSF